MRLLSFALLAKTIQKLFPANLARSIFRLVNTYQFLSYEQMLGLTCHIIHFLVLGLFVHNLQKNLLNCAPFALSRLLTLPIIVNSLRAYRPYHSLIRDCMPTYLTLLRVCAPLLLPLSTLRPFLCLVLCCFSCKEGLKTLENLYIKISSL